MGTPFPGVGRNTLRANRWNNLDASIFKNTRIRERYNLQLQFSAYNVLNHRQLGTPDPEIDDTTTFWNNDYNSGVSAAPARSRSAPGSPSNLQPDSTSTAGAPSGRPPFLALKAAVSSARLIPLSNTQRTRQSRYRAPLLTLALALLFAPAIRSQPAAPVFNPLPPSPSTPPAP